MYKIIKVIVICLYTPFLFAAVNPDEVLEKVDAYRLPVSAAKVVSKIEQFESGQLKKSQVYDVYIKPSGDSLVLFKAGKDNTQRFLMVNKNFWVKLPKSKRPVRITPLQKLLGEASVGDVATMTWAKDYHAQVLDENDSADGQSAIKLSLKAKDGNVTYDKIILWINKDNYQPIKAEYYLLSGKLAKLANFKLENQGSDGEIVKSMELIDAIEKKNTTTITYDSILSYELPDKYYNPSFLSVFSASDLN